jgi:hypothetical protein
VVIFFYFAPRSHCDEHLETHEVSKQFALLTGFYQKTFNHEESSCAAISDSWPSDAPNVAFFPCHDYVAEEELCEAASLASASMRRDPTRNPKNHVASAIAIVDDPAERALQPHNKTITNSAGFAHQLQHRKRQPSQRKTAETSETSAVRFVQPG